MTTPTVFGGNIGSFVSGLLGGASGTLGGTNSLQQSIDQLSNQINRLTTVVSMGGGGPGQQQGYANQQARGFPGVVNPFNNNPNQPGIGGGGAGGAGNVAAINTFGSLGAGVAGIVGSFAGYGAQQLPQQLTMNAYATISSLGLNNPNAGIGPLYRQAFGYGNRNLNALASSPQDAAQMYQILQYTGGNPLVGSTSLGRAALGAASAFGLTNPTLSGAQSASLASQIYNPVTSLLLRTYGYPVSPRTLGGGAAQSFGTVAQSILRGWFSKNSVSPSQLANTLALGGRGNLNLQALGIDPTQFTPVLEGYNQLFNAGYSPQQATNLFLRAGRGGLAGRAAQRQLASLGVTTAASDIQAIRNNQAALTGRDSAVASSFNSALVAATHGLDDFNRALTAIMQRTGLTGAVGGAGGFLSALTGTNHGNVLTGLGGSALAARGLWSLLGGGAGGGGALAGVSAGGVSGAAGLLGVGSLGLIGTLGQAAIVNSLKSTSPTAKGWLNNRFVNPLTKIGLIPGLQAINPGEFLGVLGLIKDLLGHGGGSTPLTHNSVVTRFGSGGIVPGYQPGLDSVPAMLSRGEAVLNPGAARAVGTQNINYLNALHAPAGAGTVLKNGTMFAAGGTGSVYMNPLRRVSGLTPERIDMGVDYGGNGPVYALGPGIVTNANTAWSGAIGAPYPGYFISYKLTGGPDAGKYVYVAEDIWPSVKVGQRVTTNTVIGNMRGGIETGWAAPPGTGTTMAAQAGQTGKGSDPGSVSSAYGVSFSALLASLGAPPGLKGSTVVGSAPSPFGSSSGSSSGTTMAGTGSVGSVGFSESSLIPVYSELAALSGSGSGGSGSSGSGSPTTGTGNRKTPNGGFGNVPGVGGSRAQNKALMMKLAAKYGWGSGPMWAALNSLVMSESGFDNHAQNPTSTAYGIGQFLDSTWAGFGPKTSNPRLQEIYMLEYIKQRYKNPERAWSFHQANNWYGAGGNPPADSIGIVGERGPELVNFGVGGSVISNAQTANLLNGTYARPAQSPWMSGGASHYGFGGSGGGTVNIIFRQGSVNMNFGSHNLNASSTPAIGNSIANEFVKALQDHEIIKALARGDKL